MTKRMSILIGMALGILWGVGVIWTGTVYLNIPIFSFTSILLLSFIAPGLVFAAMIGRVAQRRFFDEALIDGKPTTGAADIDQRVLQNTLEQLVLAMAIWPGATHLMAVDGPGVLVTLGLGFAIARILFWIGYHISPPLRAFGFAATFYPTIMAMIWAGIWWAML